MPLIIKKKPVIIPKKFKLEYVSPKELIPYPGNTKTHPLEQITTLAGSIATFKFDVPIVVDGDGVIIKGHGRRAAAIHAGIDKVPVIRRTDLSQEQVQAARIADNKLAETPWDEEALALELKQLEDLNFDLNSLGFNEAEISRLFSLEEPGDIDYSGEWEGMPEFESKDVAAFRSIIVHFHDEEEVAEFCALLDVSITDATKYVYFKEEEIHGTVDDQYVDEPEVEVEKEGEVSALEDEV